MCAICGRVLAPHDLQPLGGGTLMVCRAARWCLVAAIHQATPVQIATMHATASDLALTASQTISVKRTGPKSRLPEVVTRSDGLPDFVRLPIP